MSRQSVACEELLKALPLREFSSTPPSASSHCKLLSALLDDELFEQLVGPFEPELFVADDLRGHEHLADLIMEELEHGERG